DDARHQASHLPVGVEVREGERHHVEEPEQLDQEGGAAEELDDRAGRTPRQHVAGPCGEPEGDGDEEGERGPSDRQLEGDDDPVDELWPQGGQSVEVVTHGEGAQPMLPAQRSSVVKSPVGRSPSVKPHSPTTERYSSSLPTISASFSL